MAKADTGATKHYIKCEDESILTDIQPVVNGPEVKQPDCTTLKITKRGFLPFHPSLTNTATQASVLPKLRSSSLVAIGQLCDDNCVAVFDKKSLSVYKNNKIILKGTRNHFDGLWDIIIPFKRTIPKMPTLTPQPSQHINIIIRKQQTKHKMAEYFLACAFNTPIDTFQKAKLKGNLHSWPGIDELNFRKLLDINEATAKGHMHQERQNLQSTKNKIIHDDMFPGDTDTIRKYEYMYSITTMTPKDTTYGDLTGRFPCKSTQGNQYVMVVYDYNANVIWGRAIKNRQAATITSAWKELRDMFTVVGHRPTHYVMDNKINGDLRDAIKKENMQLQLTPPNIHRRNAAERAIQTWKNHFLSGLATCHPQFPVREWDRLIPQANITLNLLRSSRINPRLSAYAFIFGIFNFNATPLAPPGTKVIIHKKTKQRGSWAYHGVPGWYIGPSMEHYRCVKCHVPGTGADIDVDTVTFIQHHTPIPEVTDRTAVRQAVEDILHILKHPSKNNIPTYFQGDPISKAFQQLATTLGNNKRTLAPVLINNNKHHTKNTLHPPKISETPQISKPSSKKKDKANKETPILKHEMNDRQKLPFLHVIPPDEVNYNNIHPMKLRPRLISGSPFP